MVSLSVFKMESLRREIRDISFRAVVERVTGHGHYHARVAQEIFRDYPVFGVGGWGYPVYLHQYLQPEEVKHMQIQGGANVHNDSLQFLAEQGSVGYGLLLLAVALLAGPLLWQVGRLCFAPAGLANNSGKGASWFHRIPSPVVGVWVGTAATVCHSLGDLPFRAPSILLVWMLAFVCAPGWVPATRGRGVK